MIGIGAGIGISRMRDLAALIRAMLFGSGEVGVMYDISDLTTMFQDSAGTTPVTGVEQPVGKILDKSGNGNHATQATSTARPILRQDAGGRYYLDFDGVDDFLVTSAIDFTGTDKMSVFAGVTKDSDAAAATLVELSANWNLNSGSFNTTAPNAAANTYGASSRGDAAAAANQAAIASGYTAPNTAVLSITHNISGDLTTLSVNTVAAAGAIGDKGAGSFGNYPLYIGMRAGTSLPLNGRIYSLIVRGALSDAAQIAAAESYVAGKTGVTL